MLYETVSLEALLPAKVLKIADRFVSETYVLVALAPAEPEDLCIVANKGDALAGVGRAATEVARFDPRRMDCQSPYKQSTKRENNSLSRESYLMVPVLGRCVGPRLSSSC